MAKLMLDSVREWIRHVRGFFLCSFAKEDIACDVDEVLWPDPER